MRQLRNKNYFLNYDDKNCQIEAKKINKVTNDLTISGNLDVTGTLNNSKQHFIVSSSAGSITTLSSALNIIDNTKAYHIMNPNGFLILSSSGIIAGAATGTGSVVFISGSLWLLSGSATTKFGTNTPKIFFGNPAANLSQNGTADACLYKNVTQPESANATILTWAGITTANGTVDASHCFQTCQFRFPPPNSGSAYWRNVLKSSGLFVDPNFSLAWSSVANRATGNTNVNVTRIYHKYGTAGGFPGILYVSGSSGSAGFTADSGPFVLSSSLGSLISISGVLDIGAGAHTSATLPTAPPIGTIAFVSDMGCVAVYTGTDKWLRLSSGSF